MFSTLWISFGDGEPCSRRSAANGCSSKLDGDLSFSNQQCVLNEVLPMTCNEQYEMRVETMDDMLLDGMSRLVCGFMNTVHPESQILSGIQPDYPSVSKATVVGMPCDQEARDRFRVCFSKLMSQQITPPIMSGTITTRFWPVVDGDSREPIDDLFVIGIVIRKPTCLQPTLHTAITALNRQSYVRRGAYTQRVTPTVVYAWTISAVEKQKFTASSSNAKAARKSA